MKRQWAAALCMVVGLFSGCTARPVTSSGEVSVHISSAAYHKITPEEAKDRMDAGGVTIVDVRRAEEYEENHIPGAILVTNETLKEQAAKRLPVKDAVLLVYCRTGVRSRQASETLVSLGYQQVYDFGGSVDWPFETESGEFQTP